MKRLKNSKNWQTLSQKLLNAIFWNPKILVEKKEQQKQQQQQQQQNKTKQKTLGTLIKWDRQTEKQKETKGTKRAKCYYYLVRLARVAF